MKIAYDLGSVSLYEHQALDFFIAIQFILKDKLINGDKPEIDSRSIRYNATRGSNDYSIAEGKVEEQSNYGFENENNSLFYDDNGSLAVSEQ